MANTGRTQVPNENTSVYDRTLLTRAVPEMLHTKFAQIRDIPKNAGTNTIKFRRYSNLAAATTPLTAGITPVGSQLSVTDITATTQQYGDYITLEDILVITAADPVLLETAELLGDQVADTLDQLARDIMAAGTGVTFASGTNRSDTTAAHKISDVLIKKVARLMKNNNAKKLTRMVNPDTGYATSPIPACYVGIVHTNTVYDLEAITGWLPVEKYANKAQVMPSEIGYFGGVRFLESTNAKVFVNGGLAGAVDVYATLFLAMNAVGQTRISGEALKNIIKPLGAGEDPLNQRCTSGWKATYVAKILNDDFMHRLEHGVTA